MNFFTALLAQMPDAVAKGLIWGLMALGVYITYKILDFPDLTVDGSLCTGGAVAAVMPFRRWKCRAHPFSQAGIVLIRPTTRRSALIGKAHA